MLVPDAASAPSLADLASIMKRLRDPQTGCAWDREQTFETIAPYTIEEAYEVADAIERGDMTSLVDELGDLQLQIVFTPGLPRKQAPSIFRTCLPVFAPR
jgi:NTP pyrophosphatase (non-canonical NTP hydrolase)